MTKTSLVQRNEQWNASNDAQRWRPLGQVQSLNESNGINDSWSDQSTTSATTSGTSSVDLVNIATRISLMTSTQPSLVKIDTPSNESTATDYANEDRSMTNETSTISTQLQAHFGRHLNISAGSLNTDKIVSNNYEAVDGNDDENNRNTSILYNNDKMSTKALSDISTATNDDNNKANKRMNDNDSSGSVGNKDDKKEGKFLNKMPTTTTSTLSDRSAIRMASADKHLTSNDKVSAREETKQRHQQSHHYCPPGVDSKWNLTWAQADAGFLALQTCPAPYAGIAHRACALDGRWHDTDPSECRLKPLELVCILVSNLIVRCPIIIFMLWLMKHSHIHLIVTIHERMKKHFV